MRNIAKRVCTFALVIAAFAPVVRADDAASWNQWRGPARDGSVPGNHWPAEFNGLERQWRVELGKGYPGPVV